MKRVKLEREILRVFSGVYLGEATLENGKEVTLIHREDPPQENKNFIYTDTYLGHDCNFCFYNRTYDISWERIKKEVKTLRR